MFQPMGGQKIISRANHKGWIFCISAGPLGGLPERRRGFSVRGGGGGGRFNSDDTAGWQMPIFMINNKNLTSSDK
jgi:hypothetical protein